MNFSFKWFINLFNSVWQHPEYSKHLSKQCRFNSTWDQHGLSLHEAYSLLRIQASKETVTSLDDKDLDWREQGATGSRERTPRERIVREIFLRKWHPSWDRKEEEKLATLIGIVIWVEEQETDIFK